MNIIFNEKTEIKVLLEFEDKLFDKSLNLSKLGYFNAKAGEVFPQLDDKGKGHIFLGLGSLKLDIEDLRLAGFNLYSAIKKYKIKDIAFCVCNLDDKINEVVPYLVEGLYHGAYNFQKYLSNKTDFDFNLYIPHAEDSLIKKVDEVKNIMNAMYFTRDLVNMPANHLYPKSYVEILQEEFKDLDVEVNVFNKKQMEELNMHAALSVSLGSDKEPYFVVLKYQPNKKSQDFLTLVGKGLTYDSGGYAIKSAGGMVEMHTDMGGSASVFGALKAIALNKVKQNVYAVSAILENLINGSAYKNGDVISSMKGTSIFVGNTDAEGRITLADSIYYAATKLKSKAIIELSTLTGACIRALGDDISGIVTQDDKLFLQLEKASKVAKENIHRFPITKKIDNLVKGTISDVTNMPGGPGAITAGLFLKEFAEGKPYIHMDIAGTAFVRPYSYYKKGATGVAVRTLYELAKKFK